MPVHLGLTQGDVLSNQLLGQLPEDSLKRHDVGSRGEPPSDRLRCRLRKADYLQCNKHRPLPDRAASPKPRAYGLIERFPKGRPIVGRPRIEPDDRYTLTIRQLFDVTKDGRLPLAPGPVHTDPQWPIQRSGVDHLVDGVSEPAAIEIVPLQLRLIEDDARHGSFPRSSGPGPPCSADDSLQASYTPCSP